MDFNNNDASVAVVSFQSLITSNESTTYENSCIKFDTAS